MISWSVTRETIGLCVPIKYFVEVYEHTLLYEGTEGCRASSADDAQGSLNTVDVFYIDT